MHNRCWWLALFRSLGDGVGLTVDSHIFFRGEPTPFFVLILKYGWQLFFRKSGPGSNGKSNQGGADAAPR